eukprot:jgi/Chlat1/3499/Chrsp23S03789
MVTASEAAKRHNYGDHSPRDTFYPLRTLAEDFQHVLRLHARHIVTAIPILERGAAAVAAVPRWGPVPSEPGLKALRLLRQTQRLLTGCAVRVVCGLCAVEHSGSTDSKRLHVNDNGGCDACPWLIASIPPKSLLVTYMLRALNCIGPTEHPMYNYCLLACVYACLPHVSCVAQPHSECMKKCDGLCFAQLCRLSYMCMRCV